MNWSVSLGHPCSGNSYTLLALCARPQGHPTQHQRLVHLARDLSTWEDVVGQAEAHGLAPLLYVHLRSAGVALPPPVRRALQGLTLRHRHANQVRARVLSEILGACQAAGIQTLVLKGAVLAHLVYPEPGLRPMRDIDILVRRSEVRRTQALLADLGFEAPLPPQDEPLRFKHLGAAKPGVEGIVVSVDVHHNLYTGGTRATALEALRWRAVAFELGGRTAYTLGHEDMLDHVYRHLVQDGISNPIRLIGVADMVGLAERFAAEIDWSLVRRRYPHILNCLALFHHMTPLSEALLRRAPVKVGHAPQGVGLEFQGWPRSSVAAQRDKGWWGILRDTLYPSEWWLRLYYGVGAGLSYSWTRWVRHPLHILRWVAHYFSNRGA